MAIYKKNQGKGQSSFQSPYKKRLIEIARLANYEPKASIMSPNNDFNYTYALDGHLKRKLRLSQLQTSPFSNLKNQSRNYSLHTKLPKLETKINKIQNHPTLASEPKQHLPTIDTRIQTQQLIINSGVKQSSSPQSPNANKNKQKRKKIKQRYKINQISSDQSQSDQEFSTNATPGPGYYSVTDSSMYRNSRKLTDFSFGSKASRFIQNKTQSQPRKIIKNPEIQQKNQKHRQIVYRKKIIPFMSCSLKNDNFVPKQQVPGPQDYHPRSGIEQQLIRKIQRNFKGNFGVYQQRFKFDDKYAHLGPGSYSLQKQKQIQAVPGSYYFLSQQKRFT